MIEHTTRVHGKNIHLMEKGMRLLDSQNRYRDGQTDIEGQTDILVSNTKVFKENHQ